MADSPLFEKTIKSNPTGVDLTNRFAFGKAGTPTYNITVQQLITYLNNMLAYMKGDNNLSEITSTVAARTKLDVYSTSEVQSTFATVGALSTTNAKFGGTQIMLTAGINSDGSGAKFDGSLDLDDSEKTSTGRYKITHNFGSTDYIVLASVFNNADQSTRVCNIDYTANYFHIQFTNLGGSALDSAFRFVLMAI